MALYSTGEISPHNSTLTHNIDDNHDNHDTNSYNIENHNDDNDDNLFFFSERARQRIVQPDWFLARSVFSFLCPRATVTLSWVAE